MLVREHRMGEIEKWWGEVAVMPTDSPVRLRKQHGDMFMCGVVADLRSSLCCISAPTFHQLTVHLLAVNHLQCLSDY